MHEPAGRTSAIKDVHAALRRTTEALAIELAAPSRAAPRWSEFEWLVARATAAIHGVSPLLSRGLAWRGPEGWEDFVSEQWRQTARRHASIVELLRALDLGARRRNLPIITLKGVALHDIGVYQAGERPMADVDLLVRPEHGALACDLLAEVGYRQSWINWKHRVFAPSGEPKLKGSTLDPQHGTRAAAQTAERVLGEHASIPIKIELHERIAEVLPLRRTDISSHIFPAKPSPGLSGYPSRPALLMHLLLHAAGAMAYRRVRLINLHDIALLCRRMSDRDWEDIQRWTQADPRPWWALPPLQLVARYYTGVVPDRVLTLIARSCPWLLTRVARRRTLTDASLSYLWVEAFPGIEWSRSVGEIALYILSRIRPNRETLDMRRALASTESWAADDCWYQRSHGGRILGFLFSRIPRAPTMHSVRAALERGIP